MTRRRRTLAPTYAILTTFLMVVAGAAIAGGSSVSQPLGAGSGLPLRALQVSSVNPVVANVLNFTITSASSGSSGTFDVAPGDLLVVFIEMFGTTTVTKVDSGGSAGTCAQEAYTLQHANGGTHGFAIWACSNVQSGPATEVSITLSVGSSDSAAVEIVDVNGGNPNGGTPAPFVDQVGLMDHSDSRMVSRNLTVDPDDLVLAGIGTWSQNTMTVDGAAQLLGEVTAHPTDSQERVTAGTLSYENRASTPANVWMNATLAESAPAIEGIITLGAVAETTLYPVEFSETGLPNGTTWCLTLQGENGTSCIESTSSTLERTNGTYPWNVSVPGPATYVISPSSASSLTVEGTPVQVQLTFTKLPGTHFIQHVVVIYLENEPLSSVKADGPYEDYLAANYEAASRWFAPCHPSAPEYIALISATTNQCGSDLYPGSHGGPPSGGGTLGSYRNVTLGDLLQNSTLGPGGKNFTWADYAENLPSNACTDPAKYDTTGLAKDGYGLFVSKHVPFLYEADTVYRTGFCENHVLSLEPGGSVNALSFNGSVAAGTMANFSFITPNICDDGHSPCNGIWPNATCTDDPASGACASPGWDAASAEQDITHQADIWLNQFLSALINGTGPYASGTAHENDLAEMNHTAFFILYDESESAGDKGTAFSGGFYIQNEPANNNAQHCKYSLTKKTTRSVCGGNIYEVTVIPNREYWNPATQAGYTFTEDDSDYGITATVEWLFNLTGSPGSFCQVASHGFSNRGCLDSLWMTDPGSPNNFDPLTSEFLFGPSGNGYTLDDP